MIKKFHVSMAIIFSFFLTSGFAFAVPGTTLPDGRTRVVFSDTTDRPGNIILPRAADLFSGVLTAEGISDVVRLTHGEGHNYDAVWFPDGDRILFFSSRAGVGGLFTIRPDGSDLIRLGVEGVDPSLSPDGEWMAFTRSVRGIDIVFVSRLDGSAERRVGRGDHSSWSPDGRFVLAGGGVYDVATSSLVAGFLGDHGAWSPGGNFISSEFRSQILLSEGIGGEPVAITPGGNSHSDFSFWTANNELVYRGSTGRDSADWFVYDLESGQSRAFLSSRGVHGLRVFGPIPVKSVEDDLPRAIDAKKKFPTTWAALKIH